MVSYDSCLRALLVLISDRPHRHQFHHARAYAQASRSLRSRRPRPSFHCQTTLASRTSFAQTRKDKRTIKHETFLARIEKSRKKKLKRRRPSKKLVTNLDSLADALPGSDDDEDTDMEGSPRAKKTQGLNAGGAAQSNIIKQKSLKHKPGALKKKEKIDARERERFQRNLAQMSSALKASREASRETASATGTQASAPAQAQAQAQPPTQTQDGAVSNRWAALRNFISQTMEQNPAFAGQQNNAA